MCVCQCVSCMGTGKVGLYSECVVESPFRKDSLCVGWLSVHAIEPAWLHVSVLGCMYGNADSLCSCCV